MCGLHLFGSADSILQQNPDQQVKLSRSMDIHNPERAFFNLLPWTLTYMYMYIQYRGLFSDSTCRDLDIVKLTKCATYLHRRLSGLKVVSRRHPKTPTDRHTEPTAQPGPLKRSAEKNNGLVGMHQASRVSDAVGRWSIEISSVPLPSLASVVTLRWIPSRLVNSPQLPATTRQAGESQIKKHSTVILPTTVDISSQLFHRLNWQMRAN